MATTWNPADKGASVTLSGGDLSVSITAPSQDGVRATASISTGKKYFEFTCATVGATSDIVIGVANASYVVSGNQLGQQNTGLAYRPDGAVYYNGVLQASVAAWANGDVIGMAVDADAHEVKFYLNNTLQATVTSAAVPTGALFPASSGDGAGVTTTGTVRFLQSSFTYSPPAGYTAFDTVDFSHTGSGGVLVGGEATVSANAHVMTGGVTVGGAATIEFHIAFVHAGSGGVTVGGAATIEFSRATVYDVAAIDAMPQGGVRWGGAATVMEVIPHVPSGGFVWGGAAAVDEKHPLHVPSGGFVWGGSAPDVVRFTHVPSGGFVWGGSAPDVVVFPITPSGGFVWGGGAPDVVRFPHLPSGGFAWGGAAVIDEKHPLHVPSGGIVWGGEALAYMLPSGVVLTAENPHNRDFPGWALNLDTNVPSRYERMAANSFCRFRGRTYVANAGGVYRVAGKNDAGQPIRWAVMLGETDYGSERNKRISDLFLGIRAEGDIRVRVRTNEGDAEYYVVPQEEMNVAGVRVELGRGHEGRYWDIAFGHVDGAHFELESLWFRPGLLKRPGR